MLKLYRHKNRMSETKANVLADSLTRDDEDGWVYEAVHDAGYPSNSYVNVYDADGKLLGPL